MVLGGTRFIGAAIVEELAAYGHELLIVHRGEHEPSDLPEADHLHTERANLPHLRGAVDDFAPEGVVDTYAMTAADAETALAAVGDDPRLLVLSSMDVYRAYGSLLAGVETDPLPIDETSPVREQRYPYRGHPALGSMDIAERSRSCGGCAPGASASPAAPAPSCGPEATCATSPAACAWRWSPRPPSARSSTWGRAAPGRWACGRATCWRPPAAGRASSGSLTPCSPRTSACSAPRPSTCWWTPARHATCSAGPRPTPTTRSSARSPGTSSTLPRPRRTTSPPTTVPWPPLAADRPAAAHRAPGYSQIPKFQ